MITDTEGIVLRQVKAPGGRRMITLFSQKFGKISVGTSLNEGGRTKAALAVRAFSYGRYELFKNRESYNLNNGQVIKSFYAIGEDLDKYMAAAYVLELTEKILPEELPQPRIFSLLIDFLSALEKREKKHKTLVMAYMIKVLDIMGHMPVLDECACCGKPIGGQGPGGSGRPAASTPDRPDGHAVYFSIEEGGIVCGQCAGQLRLATERPVIYKTDIGIIEILKYFQRTPMGSFSRIALNDDVEEVLQRIMKEYISYHMDIKELKSESFF